MNHLDLLTKIREGVSLRSLEQRSPLNIYVEEADKQFENLKLSVARGMIITLHRYSVPNANREFIKHFIATNPAILTQPMIDNYLPDDVKKEFNKDQITVNEISSNENKELEK
jgi:preprotein translocase subunit SecA